MIHSFTSALFLILASATYCQNGVLNHINHSTKTFTTNDGSEKTQRTTEYQFVGDAIKNIAWNMQGTYFALATETGTVQLFNEIGVLQRIYASGKKLLGVCFSSQGDGMFLINDSSIDFWNMNESITPFFQTDQQITCWQLDPQTNELCVTHTGHSFIRITKEGNITTHMLHGDIHTFSILAGDILMLDGMEDSNTSDGFTYYNGTFQTLRLKKLDRETWQEKAQLKIGKSLPGVNLSTIPGAEGLIAYNSTNVWYIDAQTMTKTPIEFRRSAIDLGCFSTPQLPFGYNNAYIAHATGLLNGNILIIEQDGNAYIFNHAGTQIDSFYIGQPTYYGTCMSTLSHYMGAFGTNYRAAISNTGILIYDSHRIIHITQ